MARGVAACDSVRDTRPQYTGPGPDDSKASSRAESVTRVKRTYPPGLAASPQPGEEGRRLGVGAELLRAAVSELHTRHAFFAVDDVGNTDGATSDSDGATLMVQHRLG